MRVLKRIALFVDWLIVLLLGASVVVWTIWGFFGKVDFTIPSSEMGVEHIKLAMIVILAGLVLVALNVILVWDFLSRVMGMDYLNLESPAGEVSVSVKAVQSALEKSLRGIREVGSARVRLAPPGRKGKPVDVRAYVSLRGSVVYRSISRAIVSVLEKTFNDIVGGAVPVQCHVFWEKIRQDGTAPAPGPEPSESLRPRFPVEEDRDESR